MLLRILGTQEHLAHDNHFIYLHNSLGKQLLPSHFQETETGTKERKGVGIGVSVYTGELCW